MDNFLILLQSKLDEAKSKGNINADIDKLQGQLDKLKLQAVIDPNSISSLAKQLENILNQKIVISNIGINNGSAIKSAQQTVRQIGNAVNQGVNAASKSAGKVLRDFSELNDAKRKFVDGHDLISQEDIADAERFYDTVRKAFSEFGKVTVSKGSMNDGSLDSMRVKIEQANGEMKIFRDFMLYFNEANGGFKLVDDDTIRTAEKTIQHLNAEKNIKNATNEEANAIKAKLAEQEKYYKNIKNEVNNLYNLKTKLISADELQTAELEKQIKQTKERISYNNKQIDKKDLRDKSLDRQINDLEAAKQKQLALASAKSRDAANTKELAQAEREAVTALKERQSIEAQANKIQLSMEKGDYKADVDKAIAKAKLLVDENDNERISTTELASAYSNLTAASKAYIQTPTEETQQKLIASSKLLEVELDKVKNATASMNAEFVKDTMRLNRASSMQQWIDNNTKATRKYGSDLKSIISQMNDLNATLTNADFTKLVNDFKRIQIAARQSGDIGLTMFDKLKQAWAKFGGWSIATGAMTALVSKTREAISELKEIDSIMTEISKVSDLTDAELSKLGRSSFKTASKYGRTASDYLTGIQEMSRAGFHGKAAEEMAELSVLAQSAGDLQKDLANDYIIASNAAFGYAGNIEKLNALLDAQNQVTNRNAVSMDELADATKVAANQLANANIKENEMTALLGTGIATTREAGETVGRAIKGVVMNLQQVSGEFDGEIIDEESLKKVEERCRSVGVELEYMKDGIARLRNPMDVLKDLARVYNSLPDDSAEKAGIIADIGGKYRGNVLSSILSNWSQVEKMLGDYENATGSAMEEAMKSANNWEGSLNRLKNTWTDTVENVANSDAITTIINGFNGLLSVGNKFTEWLGSLGTIGLGGALFAGFKNVGGDKMYSPVCFEYADSRKCSYGYISFLAA